VSIQLGAGFCGKEKKESYASLTTGTIYELTNKVTGYSASGVLKLYLKNNQPLEGFYFAPMVRYNNYNFEIYNSAVSTSSTIPYSFVKYNMHFFEGSVCFGFQVIAGSRFTLDTYLGGGIRMSNDDKPTTYTKDNYMFKTIENQNATGVFPRAGFQIGVAF
jgi:putative salt-induced outer membrane protein YdiY